MTPEGLRANEFLPQGRLADRQGVQAVKLHACHGVGGVFLGFRCFYRSRSRNDASSATASFLLTLLIAAMPAK
jgi:hypothetical protein